MQSPYGGDDRLPGRESHVGAAGAAGQPHTRSPPDGAVINMGGNRTDKVYFTAPPSPVGSCQAGRQCSNQERRDAGVPVGQVFKPPYFYKGDRPDIKHAPGEISYGEGFGR